MTREDKLRTIFQKSIQLRGLVLDATIDIERKIDDYLSSYFCNDEIKGNELKEMLWFTERIALGGKKDIFFILIKRNKKDFLVKYPDFIDKLDKLIPHRNIFAHRSIDYSESILDKPHVEVVFKRYDSGKSKPKTYTVEDVQNLTNDIKEVLKCMDEL
jgi:hypothetical protein